MCGICGVIGGAAVQNLRHLQRHLAHRGPDDSGMWQQGPVAFGHLRLSIIDLSAAGHQPMRDPATGCVVVFNGEIYNYIELKRELQSHYAFTTHTDTEVLLAAFVTYGESFLTRLRGMFALAIFDPRTQEIWLARDRVGIKPLYYRERPEGFYFASEIKALIGGALGTAGVNEKKAAEFLVARQLDTDDETMFQEVRQVRPAHVMRMDVGGKLIEYKSFWHLPETGSRIFEPTDREELVSRFDETLRLHLRSDVPLGSFVSGGLDSSTVTSFALRNLPKSYVLNTFSGILPGGNPENELIPRIQELDGIVAHNFRLDGQSFFEELPRVIYQHDEPLLDGSMYSHFKLCELAHQQGMKVLLSGAGGDELFGGYFSHISSYLGHLLQRGQLLKFFHTIKNVASQSEYGYGYLMGKGVQQALPATFIAWLKNQEFRRHYQHLNLDIAIPHFYHITRDAWRTNVLNNYLSWTVPPYLHYEDRNSMAFGIEIRVPFYDHVLMEWVMQFDPGSIIQGRSKSLMRDSFRGIVPDAILDQKGKYGFPSPIDQLLRSAPECRSMFFDLAPANPYFKKNEVEEMGNRFFRGEADLGMFWRTLSFATWYQRFQ